MERHSEKTVLDPAGADHIEEIEEWRAAHAFLVDDHHATLTLEDVHEVGTWGR